MSYSGGYDGNSNSKGAENKPSVEASFRLQLDGSKSVSAQARVLGLALNPAGPDLTFKESSVKDVTDKARASAASKLQQVLEKMLVKSDCAATCKIEGGVLKRKASSALVAESSRAPSSSSSSASAPKHESDMRQEVRDDVEKLKKIRLSGGAEVDAAISILRNLASQPMSASCLKITKSGMEINEAFWKSNQNSKIRELSTAIVHKWRSLYRAETGTSDPPVATTNVSTTRCRTLAMILEETCHSHVQKVKPYADFIDEVSQRLLNDRELAAKVARDSSFATEFIKLLADRKKKRGNL